MIVVLSEDILGVSTLLNRTTIIENETVNGFNIYKVRFENTLPFIILVSGYGKVNIARAIQYVDTKYCIDKLIVTGNTGSLNETTAPIGTVGISTSALQYDIDFTALGAEPFSLLNQEVYTYDADENLITKARGAAIVGDETVNTGLFATADRFLANTQEATTLQADNNALFVDTSTADVGQVAYFNQIPYVAIKGVSNYAGDDAVAQYNANINEANQNANNIVYQLLVNLIGINDEVNVNRCQNRNCNNPQTITWNGCYNPQTPCNRFWF